MRAYDFGFGARGAVAAFAMVLGSCGGDSGPRYATEFVSVDVAPGTSRSAQLAVQACAGLKNRRIGGSVYVRVEANDDTWLTNLGLTPANVLTPAEFLDACAVEFPRCVRYDYGAQQKLLPNILTVASATDAIPLDVNDTVACNDVVFDATVEFATANTPELATQLVADRYLARTTGLAMLNPGYDQHAFDLENPPINRDMPSYMVDFVFSKRLFDVFLVNGCISSSGEQPVLSSIVNNGRWTTPVPVWGYNSSWLYAGYLYEAQTNCLPTRNMGAVAAEARNLSFFSTRRPPIRRSSELPLTPPQQVTFDPSKKYIAFVIGDGDNIQFVMSSRRQWLADRTASCAASPSTCAPLTWSISPHLAENAPDVLEWYAETSRVTGNDWFILPPSGHLYAYPSLMNDADQRRFIAQTEADARILATHTVVQFDENGSWDDAENVFIPKYAHAGSQIRGVVPINAPYVFPPFPNWAPSEFYRVLRGDDGSPVVVWKQREWRGVDDSDTEFFVSPQNMANEIAAYPDGTVLVIYTTSDGGLSLANSFDALIPLLPANVQLVSSDAAAELAIQASGN